MEETEKNKLIDQAVVTPDVKERFKVEIIGYHFFIFLFYALPAFVSPLISDQINAYTWKWSFNFIAMNYVSVALPIIYLAQLVVILGLMIISFFKKENRNGLNYLFVFLILAIFYFPIGLMVGCSKGC
ncbi:MAG: hypothetical protein V4509_03585 [Patescibacteria group bacterium]